MPKPKPPTDDVNYAEIAALRLTQVQALTDELDRLEDQHALDRVLLIRERDLARTEARSCDNAFKAALSERNAALARANAAEANLSNALAAFRNMTER